MERRNFSSINEGDEMSKWEEYKKKIGDTRPWDVFSPNVKWSEEETAKQRLDICWDCDRLIKVTTQCKECGCFMKLKTRLEHAKCPLNKW